MKQFTFQKAKYISTIYQADSMDTELYDDLLFRREEIYTE